MSNRVEIAFSGFFIGGIVKSGLFRRDGILAESNKAIKPFPYPPLWKGERGWDLYLQIMKNPSKSFFQKGGLKGTGLFYTVF